jgi:hypothetical protein
LIRTPEVAYHEGFFQSVARAPNRLLIADFEGALSPFSAGNVWLQPHREVLNRLTMIMKDSKTRFIVTSERSAEEVARSLGLWPIPEIWGGDGLERLRSDGHYERAMDIPVGTLDALVESELKLRREGLGRLVRVSLAGVSVCWCDETDLGKVLDVRAKVSGMLHSLCLNHPNLCLVRFPGGMGLRVSGATKGSFLKKLISDTSFDTPIAYFGNGCIDKDTWEEINCCGSMDLLMVEAFSDASANTLKPASEVCCFLDRWIRASKGNA